MSKAPTNARPADCPQCGAPVALPEYADLAVCPFCGSSLMRAGPPVAESRPAGAEHVLHSLSCPQCAGSLSVRAGRRILLCSRCGVRILNRGQGGMSRWLFPQTVDRVRALSAAAGWLTGYPGVAKKARDAPVRNARLVHIPIWEHRALVAGWEFGTKLRTKSYLTRDEEGNERLELTVAEERFEDPHLQERRYFQAACDLQALGAGRPRFSGRELLLPLVAGELDPSSDVLEPEGTAAGIAARGSALAVRPGSGAADPHTRMLILRESLALLYYPLWLVDYQVGDLSYRVVVDANDGTVNSATAPAGNGRLDPVLGLKVAGLLAVAALAVWLASAWSSVRVPTIFLAVIVCVAAVLLVLRSPAGGKVEYHEPFSS